MLIFDTKEKLGCKEEKYPQTAECGYKPKGKRKRKSRRDRRRKLLEGKYSFFGPCARRCVQHQLNVKAEIDGVDESKPIKEQISFKAVGKAFLEGEDIIVKKEDEGKTGMYYLTASEETMVKMMGACGTKRIMDAHYQILDASSKIIDVATLSVNCEIGKARAFTQFHKSGIVDVSEAIFNN